ncbi:hypothetical protein LINPERHAP1_LOCUS158 [Linum perenne]
MIVTVMTTNASQARYRTRKGTTAIHVLDVCNQNLKFIYCLVGWEGSTHDSRVLRDALSRSGGLRVPTGGCGLFYAYVLRVYLLCHFDRLLLFIRLLQFPFSIVCTCAPVYMLLPCTYAPFN